MQKFSYFFIFSCCISGKCGYNNVLWVTSVHLEKTQFLTFKGEKCKNKSINSTTKVKLYDQDHREVIYDDIKRIEKGMRRQFHNDITVLILYLDHDQGWSIRGRYESDDEESFERRFCAHIMSSWEWVLEGRLKVLSQHILHVDKLYYSPLGKFIDKRDSEIKERLNSGKDTSTEVKQLEDQPAALM
ncbi:hypothetical protein Tco_0763134 [Tanacetum coccineum]